MKRYFASIRQYGWIVLVCLIPSLIGGYVLAKSQPPVWTASSQFVVTQISSGIPNTNQATSVTDIMSEATNDASLISTTDFMTFVLHKYPEIGGRGFSVNDLLGDVVGAPSVTTPSVTVTATTLHAVDAVMLANDVSDGFAAYIQSQLETQLDTMRTNLNQQYTYYKSLSDKLSQQILGYPANDPHIALLTGDRDNDLHTLDTLQQQISALPTTAVGDVQVVQHAPSVQDGGASSSSKTSLLLAATGGIGLVLGVLVMLLVIFLDKRLRSEEQIKEKLGLAYIGGVAKSADLKSHPLKLSGTAAQQIADVGANLHLTGVLPGPWQASHGSVLLITSPKIAEGKTTLAASLAASIAGSGKSVVVVDGNLNRPSTHLIFGMNPTGPGLSAILRNAGNSRDLVDESVVRSNVPGVWLLPAGQRMDASALLLEQKMPAILEHLRGKIDLVIIDGPAVLKGADASVLGSMADGIALVVDARHGKLPVIKRAREVINGLTNTPVGVVINCKPRHLGNTNEYFASAVPEKSEAEKWEAVAADEVRSNGHGNGNGYSHENGNGYKVETDQPVMASFAAPALVPNRVVAPSPISRPAPQRDSMPLPPSPSPLPMSSLPQPQPSGLPTMPVRPYVPSPSPRPAPRQDLTPPPFGKGE